MSSAKSTRAIHPKEPPPLGAGLSTLRTYCQALLIGAFGILDKDHHHPAQPEAMVRDKPLQEEKGHRGESFFTRGSGAGC